LIYLSSLSPSFSCDEGCNINPDDFDTVIFCHLSVSRCPDFFKFKTPNPFSLIREIGPVLLLFQKCVSTKQVSKNFYHNALLDIFWSLPQIRLLSWKILLLLIFLLKIFRNINQFKLNTPRIVSRLLNFSCFVVFLYF